MRYQSTFVVTFNAVSDAEARSIAEQHHRQLRDDLAVEGADHPYEITLDRLQTNGRDVLDAPKEKPIYRSIQRTFGAFSNRRRPHTQRATLSRRTGVASAARALLRDEAPRHPGLPLGPLMAAVRFAPASHGSWQGRRPKSRALSRLRFVKKPGRDRVR